MILMDPNELKMNVCSFVHNNEELPCLNQLTSCLWNKVRVCDFNRIINNTSTIEAEPIRHGHWIHVLDSEPYTEYVCSVCGTKASDFIGGTEMWYCLLKPNYCPNCGAKMDEKESENGCSCK